ncbi:DUF2637 domain-containing protein [Rhodococcus hoagii]|nr:DUF2637 domain-containing protein [Prescottella equi]MBM4654194.1 DUF2637 domain-containing protein [Prescottella equi]MBM4719668.1 DUF2637 domain-containing protein [Prescottella equi]NKR23465.1 DUF2637 domain-containing protein [Prescottella equi]NKT55923.1 DUF2637 domain-containing protein [Prescottella equi]
MSDLNLRAARLRLRGLVASLALAILLALAITVGAFVLSFSVLRDLAQQALLPADLAFLFPAIVDGAILGATIAVVVLNKVDEGAQSEKGKSFFTWLLVSVVCVSVIGNAYHAFNAAQLAAQRIGSGADLGMTPLNPWAAALIAVIPPLLVLAFTHGVGILIRAIGNAFREYNAMAASTEEPVNESAEHGDSTLMPDARPLLWNEDNILAPVGQRPTQTAVSMAFTPAPQEFEDPVPAEYGPGMKAVDNIVDNVAAEVISMVGADPAASVDTAAAHDMPPASSDAAGDAEAPVEGDVSAEVAAAVDDVADYQSPAVHALLAFIEEADLHPGDKDTARRKILDPQLSFEELAEMTGVRSEQLALRRYRRAEKAAIAAGFAMPPLPVVDDAAAAVAVA